MGNILFARRFSLLLGDAHRPASASGGLGVLAADTEAGEEGGEGQGSDEEEAQ